MFLYGSVLPGFPMEMVPEHIDVKSELTEGDYEIVKEWPEQAKKKYAFVVMNSGMKDYSEEERANIASILDEPGVRERILEESGFNKEGSPDAYIYHHVFLPSQKEESLFKYVADELMQSNGTLESGEDAAR